MPTASGDTQFVTLRGGVVVAWPVVEFLLALESRGAQFEAFDDESIGVRPKGLITPDEWRFLSANKIEALRVIRYAADEHGRPQ